MGYLWDSKVDLCLWTTCSTLDCTVSKLFLIQSASQFFSAYRYHLNWPYCLKTNEKCCQTKLVRFCCHTYAHCHTCAATHSQAALPFAITCCDQLRKVTTLLWILLLFVAVNLPPKISRKTYDFGYKLGTVKRAEEIGNRATARELEVGESELDLYRSFSDVFTFTLFMTLYRNSLLYFHQCGYLLNTKFIVTV